LRSASALKRQSAGDPASQTILYHNIRMLYSLEYNNISICFLYAFRLHLLDLVSPAHAGGSASSDRSRFCPAGQLRRVDRIPRTHSQRSGQLYLFLLRQPARIGVMFVREDLHRGLSIAGADTSLTSITLPVDRSRQAAILKGARARLPDDGQSVGSPASNPAADSQIGTALDRILFPITGFSLRTNATLEFYTGCRKQTRLCSSRGMLPPDSSNGSKNSGLRTESTLSYCERRLAERSTPECCPRTIDEPEFRFSEFALRATSESGMKPCAITVIAALTVFLISACDESPEPGTLPGSPASTPSDADLALGNQIADAAAGRVVVTGDPSQLAFGNPAATPAGSAQTGADLSELGGNAVVNQQAFRERFGLVTPTPDQLATWQSYDARLTAYSNEDADWPYPTAAAPNWE
jgi:hypothetical protein